MTPQFPNQALQHGAPSAPQPSAALPAMPPLRRRPIFTPYVVVWTMCGAFAIAYLATMVIAPELMEDISRAPVMAGDPQSARASIRLAADVGTIKESIAQVQLELAKLKTDVASHGERERALNAHLSALEQRLAGGERQTIETAQPAPAPEPPAAVPPQNAMAPQPAIPPEMQIEAPVPALELPGQGQAQVQEPPPPQPAQPKLINANAATARTPAATATGSIAPQAAAPAFTTAIIKPPKPLGVHLSTGASIDSLRLSWSLLADRHADALKNLEARYVATGDEANPNFDLVAGPIKSKAEAQKVCKALAAKNVPCRIRDFAGAAL